MKKFLIAIAFVFVSHIGIAQTQDEAFKKDVLKVIELNGSVSEMERAKEQVVKMIPKAKKKAFNKEYNASLPGLYDKLAKVYMETYTKEDIKAMLEFYNSPVGKKMAKKSEELAKKSQTINDEWSAGLQAIMMKYM